MFWDIVKMELDSKVERPCYIVAMFSFLWFKYRFVCEIILDEDELIISIRGTASIQDVFTDL